MIIIFKVQEMFTGKTILNSHKYEEESPSYLKDHPGV